MVEAFRTGKGVGWHEHDACLFRGRALLPARLHAPLDRRVDSGARRRQGQTRGRGTCSRRRLRTWRVDDSDGAGISQEQIPGFDYHEPSVENARKAAEAAGVCGRVNFEVASAKDYPGNGYDLVAFFDCLHDMGDPAGASKHVHSTLATDGAWMVVEPAAGDKIDDNLHPIGRVFYAASTFVCTPASRSQEVGLGLGAQAGEARLRKVIRKADFVRSAELPRRRSTWCSKPVRKWFRLPRVARPGVRGLSKTTDGFRLPCQKY